MQKVNRKYIKNVVKKALSEDLFPNGDLTTNLLATRNRIIKARIIAKQDGVISGLDFCAEAFKIVGKETIFKKKIKDGKKIKKNKVIAEIKAKTKICCTRKTTPNLRLLEKYAVRKGGGYNHRFNLSDEILIKENHINSSSSIKILIDRAIKTKKIITVEIENINQLKEVLGLKFKRILFDNMSLNELKRCLKLCKNKYETEYSGNANLKNIRNISITGVNRISVGSITHSANSFDSSLLI